MALGRHMDFRRPRPRRRTLECFDCGRTWLYRSEFVAWCIRFWHITRSGHQRVSRNFWKDR